MISLGDDYRNVTAFAWAQVKEFYPTRLDDWTNRRIQLKVKVANDLNLEEFDRLKKQTSITDPTCCLIMGFEEAVLYLAPLHWDPLDQVNACMGDGTCKRR